MAPFLDLVRRQLTPERLRFLKFCVVGGSGVFVNEFVLWLCNDHLLTAIGGKAETEAARFLVGQAGAGYFTALAVAAFATLLPARFLRAEAFLGANRLTWSGVAALEVSILVNFLLNNAWTWRDRKAAGVGAFLRRMGQYFLVAHGAGAVQLTVLKVLAEQVSIHYLVANLIGILLGLMINFAVNNLWTFRRAPGGAGSS